MCGRWVLKLGVIAGLLARLSVLVPPTSAEPNAFHDPSFQSTWKRTDKPVEMSIAAGGYD